MRNRKKKNKYMLILVIILAISIGYAAVSTTLKFTGTATVMKQSWDVHWSNPVVVEGSVNPSNVPVISEEQGDPNNTKLTWTANLKIPGEYYEFTVDTANSGTVDVMISNITSSISPALPDYIDFDIAYEDGQPLEINHKLAKATKNGNTIIPTTEKLRVRVYYDPEKATLDTLNAIPQEGVSYTFTYNITYSKATNNAVPRENTKMYYAFYRYGANEEPYPNGLGEFDYSEVDVGDILPLEFGTAITGVSSKYNGGVTPSYKKLKIVLDLYRPLSWDGESYSGDRVYNSEEECIYYNLGDPCGYYRSVSYSPQVFYGYKINGNRRVTNRYVCGIYSNKKYCIDLDIEYEDNRSEFNNMFADLKKVFGEYDEDTGKGCRLYNSGDTAFICISPDGKHRVIDEYGTSSFVIDVLDDSVQMDTWYGIDISQLNLRPYDDENW